MATKLTAVSIEQMRPSAKLREIPDGGCSGLYLVVQPSGHKSFAVRYRHSRKKCKLTLPPRQSISPALTFSARRRSRR
jgi:hypothetical protein